MLIDNIKLNPNEFLPKNEIINSNDTPMKEDTFFSLLLDKIESINEKINNEDDQKVKVSGDKNNITKEENREDKKNEIKKEQLVLDITHFLDKLKQLNKNQKSKGDSFNDSLKEGLIVEIGFLLDKIKNFNFDLDKVQLKVINDFKKQMGDVLKIKDMRDNHFLNRLLHVLYQIKESLKNVNVLERNINTNFKQNIEKTFSKEKEKENDFSLLFKNKKVEVNRTKPIQPPNTAWMHPESKNEMSSNKNNIQIKNLFNPSLDSTLNKIESGNNEIIKEAKKVDIHELMNQITQKIKINLSENKSEVVMNLKPEFLGKLSVKLEFKDNSISGKFIVDNVYAEKVIKDGMAQLKVAFQNMGMEVSNFDISMNHQPFNQTSSESMLSQKIENHFNNPYGQDQEFIEEQPLELLYDKGNWIAQNINIRI